VSGTHTDAAQAVLPAVAQVTTVAGSTTHDQLCGLGLLLSQVSVPLHKSPSSLLAQSDVFVHAQMFGPLTHVPLAQ
jgi:hypothetical protein